MKSLKNSRPAPSKSPLQWESFGPVGETLLASLVFVNPEPIKICIPANAHIGFACTKYTNFGSDILLEMGSWLQQVGDAVCGTRGGHGTPNMVCMALPIKVFDLCLPAGRI